jgi:hypothetical protein
MKKRTAPVLAIAAGCVALAVAACAAPSADAVATARLTQAARAAQSPEQLAEADAVTMLAAFRPPPGAQRSGAIAVSPLSAAPGGSTSPDFVTRTAWWRVPGTMGTVLDWVEAHPPAGFTVGGSGDTSDASVVTSRFVAFDLPPVANVLATRSLYVSVASDGADRTALRVDSQVNWLPTKPSDERIPATAKVVTITALPGIDIANGKTAPSPGRPVTITDAVTVTKIAGVVDALPLMPPGVFACPLSTGQGLRLTFRASVGGPVLAEATGYTNGCGTVTLTVGGKLMPTLWDGARLAQEVLKLAGIHWAGFSSVAVIR